MNKTNSEILWDSMTDREYARFAGKNPRREHKPKGNTLPKRGLRHTHRHDGRICVTVVKASGERIPVPQEIIKTVKATNKDGKPVSVKVPKPINNQEWQSKLAKYGLAVR